MEFPTIMQLLAGVGSYLDKVAGYLTQAVGATGLDAAKFFAITTAALILFWYASLRLQGGAKIFAYGVGVLLIVAVIGRFFF